jgi:4-hydroxy-tetrahydrodipicolinate synthase
MDKIGRLLTAMVTPFTESGEVDYVQARRLARALVESGSDGVVVSGTTGESPTLSHEEKLRLFAEVKEALDSRGAVVAGTGNYSTAESVHLSREAQALGVDGLLLVVPYYNRPTPEGLYQHFKAIAEGVALPCILYNVPSRTGRNMPAETTVRLSRIDNIVGTKEAAGDLGQVAEIVEKAPDGFRVWSGDDKDTIHVLAVGGYGVVSVASHLVGVQIRAMIQAFLDGQVAQAASLHRRLLPLVNALFLVTNPVPVKHALNTVGFPVGRPRLPLVSPDAATALAIEAALKGYRIDLPVGARAG